MFSYFFFKSIFKFSFQVTNNKLKGRIVITLERRTLKFDFISFKCEIRTLNSFVFFCYFFVFSFIITCVCLNKNCCGCVCGCGFGVDTDTDRYNQTQTDADRYTHPHSHSPPQPIKMLARKHTGRIESNWPNAGGQPRFLGMCPFFALFVLRKHVGGAACPLLPMASFFFEWCCLPLPPLVGGAVLPLLVGNQKYIH